MPEGDTIFRSARTLNRALAGRVVTRFESRFVTLERSVEDRPLVGRTVAGVRAVGKHLLIEFSGGIVLRTHMRMNGSWHIYRPGERWQRSPAAMSIVLGTDAYIAVAFDVPVAEFLTELQLARHREIRNLGPDLLAPDFKLDEAIARLKERPGTSISDALLDQRVMAGVGNVFKSETLFLRGVNPFRPVSSLSDEDLRLLVTTARDLMLANVADPATPGLMFRGYRRTTRMANPEARLWVYARTGRPCRRCGTPISYAKRGEDARGTYWCGKCQN